MISWLKKHFIPHHGNDHRPHILRSTNIRYIVYFVILIEIFTFLIPTLTKISTTGGMASVLPSVLANLTNEARENSSLSLLSINSKLTKAAELKAKDMASLGYFAHTSPEGKTPWYWLDKVGYDYQYAGENLAINFTDSHDVTEAWMNSPSHKANIVKNKYTEIGTGIATGLYEGNETIFVAQIYASPNEVTKSIPLKIIKDNKTPIQDGITKVSINTESEGEKILGAESETLEAISTTESEVETKDPSFLQELIASPRNTSNALLYIIFAIILIALLLYIVIKMKNHHLGLITNGLLALSLIGAIFITNYYISNQNQVITQSQEYTSQG